MEAKSDGITSSTPKGHEFNVFNFNVHISGYTIYTYCFSCTIVYICKYIMDYDNNFFYYETIIMKFR